MSRDPITILAYQRVGSVRPKPTHHSVFAILAWMMIIVATIYKVIVVAYAYHRSPTYTWPRFSRNVGDPELFIDIEWVMYIGGAVFALFALIAVNRKRWAAWTALGVSLFWLCISFSGPWLWRA